MSDCRKEILDILTEHDVYMNIPNSIIASSKADDLITDFESLLSKQRDLSELVEWKVSKTKEILLDFNGSDSNRLKAVATIIHSEKILEDQAINQVLSIIKDTNEDT